MNMGELCLFASHHLERNQNVGWRAVVERGTMVNVRFSRVTSVPVLVFVMTTVFQSTEHFELGAPRVAPFQLA
jgi:hypothetical protein